MTYARQIRSWLQRFSLDAVLFATLALPAFLLVSTEIAHPQSATSGELTHVIAKGQVWVANGKINAIGHAACRKEQ
jgi:imidazolonepropionase-like amidohydrolase